MVKRKMFKMLAVLLAVFVVTGSLVGCGNKNASKDGKIHFSVSNWPVKEGPSLDAANRRKQLFEEKYPNMVIEPDTWVLDLETLYPKAEAGLLPTVFQAPFTEVKKLVDGGYVYDIKSVLKDNGLEGKFSDRFYQIAEYDGKIVGYPLSMYMLGLSYNVKLFEEAGLMKEDGTPKQPKDWFEVAEFGKKIKEATGKAGFIIPTANNAGGWFFTNIAWSFGVDFMEQREDGTWEATFDTPEAVEALQFIKDLKWKYDIFTNNTLIPQEEYYKEYAVGNVGMIMSPGDISNSIKKYAMPIDEIGAMAIPAGPKRHVALLGGSIYPISASATKEQADAAVKYLLEINSPIVTDNYKTVYNDAIAQKLDGGVVGIDKLSIWSDDTEVGKYEAEVNEKNRNININHVKLYNESLKSTTIEIQPEEPICCQDLYGLLDNCIQRVLVDKDADCAELIKNANRDFQINFLDKTTY